MSAFVAPIKEVALGIYDGPHATPPEAESGPVFLGIKNVTTGGRLDLSEIRHVSEEYYPKWTRRVTPQVNDIVFSYEATLHRYALIPEGFRGCLGRRMALVRPDTEKVVPRFLHYYFLSSRWRSVVESNVISGATVDRIPLTRFPDFEIQIPEISAQHNIASILSAYDNLIENNSRRIQLLEESARLLYREWFVRLRFPGHEHVKIIDGVPEGWKKSTVSKLGDVVTGKTPSTKDPDNFGGKIPFIKTPDMHKNPIVIGTAQYLSEQGANSQAKKYIPEDSIMVSCIGTVGIVAINAIKAQTNQQINTVIPQKDHSRYYVYFALSDLKSRLEAMGGGATMVNVNKDKFESLPIVIPSDSILQEFHEVCNPIFLQIKNLLIQNQKLKIARDLLLPRLMNGEIAI